MPSMDDFELRMMDLEARLRPIANKPVDITKPGWGLRLTQCPHPLDAAGVRREADTLLQELINVYRSGAEDDREAVRRLFKEYKAFGWAASLAFAPTTEENFRQYLVLFSMKDQERDSRDAILLLQDLCRQAKASDVLIEPILREVAQLSSSSNRFGMGSTRDMLLRMC